MRKITLQNLIDKFGREARCHIWVKGRRGRVCYSQPGALRKSGPVTYKLGDIHRYEVVKVTVLFDEPKSYLINGEACPRPGVNYQIV